MKKATQLRLAFALAFTVSACADSPEERFADAQQAYARGDYVSARLHLVGLAKERPNDAQVLALLARSYLELSEPDKAKEMLTRLGKLGKLPSDGDVLRGEAELLAGKFDAALAAVAGDASAPALRVHALANLAKDEPDAALRAFRQGERAPGKRARLLADYAHFELARGNLAEARRLVGLAAREKPRPLASYIASADVAAADGQLSKSLDTFEAALGIFPQSRAAWLGRIRMLEALGRASEARQLIASAVANGGSDPTLIYLDARVDASDGKWDKVRDKLQAHERLLEGQLDANVLYAKALIELGQTEQAQARLSSLLLRSPGDRRARLLLGESRLASGRAADAIDTLRPFATMSGATAEELGALARALKSAADPQATAVTALARKAAVNSLVARLATADRAMQARDWAAAVQSYEALVRQTDGQNALVLNNLAYAYSQMGDQARALRLAERALKLAPDNASVMDTTGWLLYRSGKHHQRSLTLLRSAASKAPRDAAIAQHLAQVEAQ
jgi:tetratricopeptide (TPR) repeat protein